MVCVIVCVSKCTCVTVVSKNAGEGWCFRKNKHTKKITNVVTWAPPPLLPWGRPWLAGCGGCWVKRDLYSIHQRHGHESKETYTTVKRDTTIRLKWPISQSKVTCIIVKREPPPPTRDTTMRHRDLHRETYLTLKSDAISVALTFGNKKSLQPFTWNDCSATFISENGCDAEYMGFSKMTVTLREFMSSKMTETLSKLIWLKWEWWVDWLH